MKRNHLKIWLSLGLILLVIGTYTLFLADPFNFNHQEAKNDSSFVAKEISSEKYVVPGGASLGIIMKTHGVLVVGYSSLVNASGETIFPAKDGGITLGDCILSINDVPISSDDEMLELVNRFGKDGNLIFELKHGENTVKRKIAPVYCEDTGRYRVGLYVRDNMGGIGTLTYYDPDTQRFAALGHPVEGVETDKGTNMLGRALPSAIRGIRKATEGEVGEKIGYFEKGNFDGVIDKVGKYGIYGTLTGDIGNFLEKPIPLGKADEITTGKAYIITVVEGNRQEKFDIEILSIDKKDTEGKGLTIKITDQKLLNKTGGIVQGMSGSPIIQGGKLIGAVTYVMVNHPEKGYGCCIEYISSEI